jgi:sulfonate transport system ATP-binding protein
MLIDATELDRLSIFEHARREFGTDRPSGQSPLGVQIEKLSKHFGERCVLDNISLSVRPGEFVAIVGRSGCGKSTLLRLIAGLESPDAHADGEPVLLDGRTPKRARNETRIMFQEARLLPWRSVFENVALGIPSTLRAGVAPVLAQVGLAERGADWPAVLSGGQRQRVALARALMHHPRLLLLDEPLGALDALTRIEMQKLIAHVWERDRFTALLVTHDVAEAVSLADRVLLIEHGQIGLDLEIDFPRPRRRGDARLAALEAQVLMRVLRAEEVPCHISAK